MLFKSQPERGTLIVVDEAQRLYPGPNPAAWAPALWNALKDLQSGYPERNTNVRVLLLLTYGVRSSVV